MKRFLIILAGFAVSGVAIFGGREVPKPKTPAPAGPEVLAAEYALAQGTSFYFVLDLGSRKMELKAKGMVMKSWAIEGRKFWGRPDFPASVEISRKSALKAPKRFEIKPAEEEGVSEDDAAGFELDALEVKDMPGRFTLHSENGARISVRARSGDFFLSAGSVVSSMVWHTYVPIRHFVRTVLGKPDFAIEIVFREEMESQSVYWTFFEGIKGIIY
jgi:hypothetical protein